MKATYVVTWETAREHHRVNICNPCALQFRNRQAWPHHARDGEYCQVYHGQHKGRCDFCTHQINQTTTP